MAIFIQFLDQGIPDGLAPFTHHLFQLADAVYFDDISLRGENSAIEVDVSRS